MVFMESYVVAQTFLFYLIFFWKFIYLFGLDERIVKSISFYQEQIQKEEKGPLWSSKHFEKAIHTLR